MTYDFIFSFYFVYLTSLLQKDLNFLTELDKAPEFFNAWLIQQGIVSSSKSKVIFAFSLLFHFINIIHRKTRPRRQSQPHSRISLVQWFFRNMICKYLTCKCYYISLYVNFFQAQFYQIVFCCNCSFLLISQNNARGAFPGSDGKHEARRY